MVKIRIYGHPVSQLRPRAFLPKGWTRPVVTDAPTSRDWKRTVNSQVIAVHTGPPMRGALSMSLVFILDRPPSVSVKKRPWPTVVPDVENMSKAICDAVAGVLYVNDSQIVELYLRKEYGERPGVEIEIHELEKPKVAPLTLMNQEVLPL